MHDYGPPALRAVDPASLVAQIERTGFACLKDCFSAEEIADAEAEIRAIVRRADESYVARTGTIGLESAMLARLSSSPSFVALCDRLSGDDRGVPGKQVLRCLKGAAGIAESNYFHFDSYAITVVIPIIMPETGPRGDLIFFPHIRRRATNYLLNVLQKALLDLPPLQGMIRWAVRKGRASRIRLEPGSIYFLDGERALHANEACDPRAIRATLVVHVGETHRNHWLKRRRSLAA